jgi:uncharacterized repeat protein (TIGR01451 family)
MLPTIYSFSPGSGPTNTTVTVTGAGLNEKSPHPDVTVGGGTVTTFGTISPNTLSFNVPASATSGFITITTTNGAITNTQVFYLPASITNISPDRGAVGTMVKISGVNFTNASAVSFGAFAAAAFAVTNNNIIGAQAPSGVVSDTVSVTTPAGTATSTNLFYVAPTITSFLPTHGLANTNVVITGTSFTNATEVLFNGVAAAGFTVVNNTTINATVPAAATSGLITVGVPGGTNTSATSFTIDTTDIGVSITDTPDPVFVGSNLLYTIVVTNNGPSSAANVRLTNSLPPFVTIKGATTSQGSLNTNGSPIFGNLGSVATGSSATVTVTVAPILTGSITDSVTVASDALDSNPGNDMATAVTTVWPLPFLSITNLTSNGLVAITWPAPLSGFTLQYRTDLSTNVTWTNDTGSKVVNGTNVSVIETNIPPARFFRLTN